MEPRSKRIFKAITESQTTMAYEVDPSFKPAKKTRVPRTPKHTQVTLHTNVEAAISTKRTSLWDQEPLSWRQIPVNEAFIEGLAQRLETFATSELQFYTIQKFLVKERIPEGTYYSWIQTYPILAEAHEFALMAIGARREEMGLEGNLSAQWGIPVQAHYSSVWKAQKEKDIQDKANAAERAKADAGQKGNLNVYLTKFEKSPLVQSRGEGIVGTMSNLIVEDNDAKDPSPSNDNGTEPSGE
jgi:hypothetical protein